MHTIEYQLLNVCEDSSYALIVRALLSCTVSSKQASVGCVFLAYENMHVAQVSFFVDCVLVSVRRVLKLVAHHRALVVQQTSI
jgi:hypothetical protein